MNGTSDLLPSQEVKVKFWSSFSSCVYRIKVQVGIWYGSIIKPHVILTNTNAWRETKLIHMVLNLQRKTHPSSKTQNAYCHDIKKKWWGISVFICVSSPSTQASKRKTCVPFQDLIWAHATHSSKELKGLSSLRLAMPILCQRHSCFGVCRRMTLMHPAKVIHATRGFWKRGKTQLYARDKFWNGILWYIPDIVWFPFPGERTCSLHPTPTHTEWRRY